MSNNKCFSSNVLLALESTFGVGVDIFYQTLIGYVMIASLVTVAIKDTHAHFCTHIKVFTATIDCHVHIMEKICDSKLHLEKYKGRRNA